MPVAAHANNRCAADARAGAGGANRLNGRMQFAAPLVPATLIRRYKRFLADVAAAVGRDRDGPLRQSGLDDRARGTRARRCGCRAPPIPSASSRHSWELVEVDLGSGAELVGINTTNPNALAAEAIAAGLDSASSPATAASAAR